MPIQFFIKGPFGISRTKLPGATRIQKDDIAAFWEECDLAAERGCYVFGVRAGRGILPGYVGKATRCFEQEIFTAHKLNKYHDYLAKTKKGTPVMFFAVAPDGGGKSTENAIGECELELIYLARHTNPETVNERGIKGPSFSIPHVTGDGRGRPSAATNEFLKMLDLHDPGSEDGTDGDGTFLGSLFSQLLGKG